MRKTILVLALLLCGGFFLAAQSRSDISVYVAPVTGRGSKPEDNALFYTRLINELTLQKAILALNQKDSGFSMFGDLAPSNIEGQYVFHLGLWDNKAGGYKVEGELVYKSPDDTDQLFPTLVTSLLYTIPPDGISTKTAAEGTAPEDTVSKDDNLQETIFTDPVLPVIVFSDDWRDNYVFLGLAATWSPRIYKDEDGKTSGYLRYLPYFGLSAEYHFAKYFSLEAGVELATDELVAFPNAAKDNRYYNTMIEVPVLLKFVLKTGSSFMLEPYVGGYVSFPVEDTDRNTKPPFPLFSGLLGFQFAVKFGPGALFVDGRFAVDLNKSKVKAVPPATDVISYQRYMIHLGLGYKLGILQRKIK